MSHKLVVIFPPETAEQPPQVREAHPLPADLSDDRQHQPAPASVDIVDQLDQLDDAVFEAIAGNQAAIDRLRQLWPDVRAAAGGEMIEESREHYLRYALHLWRQNISGNELRDPSAALAALDVMELLFHE